MSFISPGTAMSMGASGHSFENLTQMQLGKGRAKASPSICPGTRYQVSLCPSSSLPLLLPSSGFVNVCKSLPRVQSWRPLSSRLYSWSSDAALISLQVGMKNADYLAAFLHVLLPLAFEVTVWWVSPWDTYPESQYEGWSVESHFTSI